MGLVVLFISATSCESNPIIFAIVEQQGGDELRANVRVNPQYRKRETFILSFPTASLTGFLQSNIKILSIPILAASYGEMPSVELYGFSNGISNISLLDFTCINHVFPTARLWTYKEFAHYLNLRATN